MFFFSDLRYGALASPVVTRVCNTILRFSRTKYKLYSGLGLKIKCCQNRVYVVIPESFVSGPCAVLIWGPSSFLIKVMGYGGVLGWAVFYFLHPVEAGRLLINFPRAIGKRAAERVSTLETPQWSRM